jgi:hypothetical protein
VRLGHTPDIKFEFKFEKSLARGARKAEMRHICAEIELTTIS